MKYVGNYRHLIFFFLLGLYRIKADSISSKELLNSNKNSSGVDDPRIHLIRVRNPWGDKNEWRGKDRYNENIILKLTPLVYTILKISVNFR